MNATEGRHGWRGLRSAGSRSGRLVASARMACLGVYVGLLWSGLAWRVGFEARYDSLFLPFILAGIFILFANLPRRVAFLGLTLLSTALCGLVLSGVWRSGVSDHSTVAGLYPFSDAAGYVQGALQVLHGEALDEFCSRRPLSTGIWAVLLFLTRENIKHAMAAMVFLCALSLVLPVRELVKSRGWAAGYLLFLGLFLYYRRFIGTTLSENLGLTLGCLGFAIIWRAARTGRRNLVPIGLVILTLAMNARAGAFFALPALALWAGIEWRGERRFSARTFVQALAAIAAGFALNWCVLNRLGQTEGYQGNFCYVAYGLTHGGDWTLVNEQHPEVKEIPAMERSQKIYSMAFQRFREKPWILASSIAAAYKDFLFSPMGAYSFVNIAMSRSILHSPEEISLQALLSGKRVSAVGREMLQNHWKYLQILATAATFALLSLLALAGIAHLRRARARDRNLMIFGWLGILASVPFARPSEADLMRAYAVTMPLFIALPATGLAWLAARKAGREPPAVPDEPPGKMEEMGFRALLGLVILALVISPIALGLWAPSRVAGGGAADLPRLKIIPGSVVTLVPERRFSAWGSQIAIRDVARNHGIHSLANADSAAEIRAFSAGDCLAMYYEMRSATYRYILLEQEEVERYGCGWFSSAIEPFLANGGRTLWHKLGAPAE